MRRRAHFAAGLAALPPGGGQRRVLRRAAPAGAAQAGAEHRVGHAVHGRQSVEAISLRRIFLRALAVVETARGEELRAGQAALRRLAEERKGLGAVLLRTDAVVVQHALGANGLVIALRRGGVIERHGLARLAGRAAPGLVAQAQQELRARQPQFRGLRKERGGRLGVGFRADAVQAEHAEIAHAHRVALVRRGAV